MKSWMPTMHAMRWVLAAIAVAVGALAGSHFGAQQERDKVATELSQHAAELAAVQQKYQSEVAQLRTQRDIADASNQTLQENLKQLRAQSLEQESAQRLYGKIEGTDVSSGLGVDTITRVNDAQGKLSELHITIVQARGRDRVKGRIGVALVGEKSGSNWREVIVTADSEDAPRFDMRFFQTIVVAVPPEDLLIDFVEIDVKPDGKRHKSFNYEMDWSGIFEN